MIQLKNVFKQVFASILLLITFSTNNSNAQVLTSEKIYERVVPTIMTLEVQNENGDYSIGTAFLVKNEGVAITCFHVIADAKYVKAKFSNEEEFLVSGIIDKDVKRDIAVIRVKCIKDNFLKLILEEPKVGADAFVIGAPRGFDFSISNGLISQIQVIDGMNQYQFTCPVSPGSSGSPLLNNKGNVVGLVTWQMKEGQNLNFAIPSKYILGLDFSLPTTPWDMVKKNEESVNIKYSEKKFNKLLANLAISISDFTAAIVYLSTENVMKDNGFRKSIPYVFYQKQTEIEISAQKLGDFSSNDATVQNIKNAFINETARLLSSAKLLIESINLARRNEGWGYQSSDLLNQSAGLFKANSKVETEIFDYLSENDDFLNSLPKDLREIYGRDNEELSFLFGVYVFNEDPTLILVVDRNTLAEKIGLRDGDRILSLNDISVENIYDIKKILLENRSKIIEIIIIRDGERETLEELVPGGS